MEEAKEDLAIKLFGRRIPLLLLPESMVEAASEAEIGVKSDLDDDSIRSVEERGSPSPESMVEEASETAAKSDLDDLIRSAEERASPSDHHSPEKRDLNGDDDDDDDDDEDDEAEEEESANNNKLIITCLGERFKPLPESMVEAAASATAAKSGLDNSIRSVEEQASPSDHHSPEKSDLNGDDDEDESAINNKDSLGANATTTTDANTEPVDDVTTTTTSSKDEEEQDQEHETKSPQNNNKTLKKPDKILPCPRCNSMETKFCYYNNYNVNQPRHYCKRCQRYWTAGGIMRNVPIGAGRRKNKNLVVASQCIHVVAPHHHHHGHLPSNGTHSNHAAVLNFGYDQGRHQEFPDTGKTLTKSKKDDASNEEQSDDPVQYGFRFPPHPPQAWPYPWNPIQWNSSLSAVALSPSCFQQLPFYPPPPFWGCSSSVIPSVWNVPNSSHTLLGKHSRDDDNENPKKEGGNPGKCFWVPKPLRIDELGEGARSSIWKTLGIKTEKSDLVGGEKSDFLKTTSSVLQANPAAFSRSLNFRENA